MLEWYSQHEEHPYPEDADMARLAAESTAASGRQVTEKQVRLGGGDNPTHPDVM